MGRVYLDECVGFAITFAHSGDKGLFQVEAKVNLVDEEFWTTVQAPRWARQAPEHAQDLRI